MWKPGGGGAWLGGARNRYNVVVTHLNREWGKTFTAFTLSGILGGNAGTE